ncbi:MAG: hypothetical protein QOH70_3706 [Blastocatellia bacterium]|jgi:hypothetical protein|nr:hypothetical protein [Blastocatellia bacterium]
MPNAQSDYPLTLAEVLFAELTATSNIDETKPEFAAVKVKLTEVMPKLTEIESLCDENQLKQILERENIKLDPEAETPAEKIWDCRTKLSKKLVPDLYELGRLLPETRSALCLSGGGVRSAVFNLGILQGLARCKLLDKFDYLSTVSGGGFIGSWLTAWIHRQEDFVPPQLKVSKVAAHLADRPDNPLSPEPAPLYNLRVYANYLTPRKGLLGVDTWTLIAVYLRNLLLNWLVFLPVIMALLMLPRLWVAFVKSTHLGSEIASKILFATGFAGAAFALVYIGVSLPGAKRLNSPERRFVYFCLVPLVISSMALTTYWVRLGAYEKPRPQSFAVFAMFLGAVPWVIYVLLKIFAPPLDQKEAAEEQRKHPGGWPGRLGRYFVATLLIFAAFAITGYLTGYIVSKSPLASTLVNLDPRFGFARLYASLAVPVLLILLTVGGTLIAGFTSRFTDVDDQEWWARAGAWILIVVIGWSAFHLLVLVGPALVLGLQRFLIKKDWSQVGFKDVATVVVGIVSGAITLLGGSSSKTPAHGEPDRSDSWKTKVLSIGTSVAAVIFGAFIVIVLALATNWILASGLGEGAGAILNAVYPLNANDPRAIIYESRGRVLLAVLFILAVAGWVLGRFINTNRFSLHYYWRNRMMRAYLGVSRDEQERAATKNKFTDFDLKDNVQMHELKTQKPMHVVNVTLNLAGGNKLEWQDRKAESFSVSPLHSGSYWLGYRDSRFYGGPDGISLATSVAISGAAASPNMGYMMTSPVVRFIMTLFNVRMGFWLGNPGVDGASTFKLPSPTQSVGPIFKEALGMTNDKSPYVYLSDGGHFDNFGLYEMILRRCRFIIVSDASTDPDYAFESLAYAIRQIRVDFGVPIEMRKKMNLGKNPDDVNNYCAIADIFYSCVDAPGGKTPDPAYDGVLIYIKPSLNGSEPADVLNFHRSDDAFPEDTITDQWFGEAQFESYRMLGSHMIKVITSYGVNPNLPPFKKIEEQAKLHLGPK